MVAWLTGLTGLVGRLLITGLLLVAPAAVFVVAWHVLHWLRADRLLGRATEGSRTDSAIGVLALSGSLPPDDAPRYAESGARESAPAVLRIDEAAPVIRCSACDRPLSEEAFCWRCGEWVADRERW